MRRSRSPTALIDWDARSRARETEAYDDLVKHGGRPLYPIDLQDEVSRDSEGYSAYAKVSTRGNFAPHPPFYSPLYILLLQDQN